MRLGRLLQAEKPFYERGCWELRPTSRGAGSDATDRTTVVSAHVKRRPKSRETETERAVSHTSAQSRVCCADHPDRQPWKTDAIAPDKTEE